MAKNQFTVLSNPIASEDDHFDKWYDEVHVLEVITVPGVVAPQRYDLAELAVPDDENLPAKLPPPTHRYLVTSELDRKPEAVMANFLERARTGDLSLSETLDLSTVSMTGCTLRGERRVANS